MGNILIWLKIKITHIHINTYVWTNVCTYTCIYVYNHTHTEMQLCVADLCFESTKFPFCHTGKYLSSYCITFQNISVQKRISMYYYTFPPLSHKNLASYTHHCVASFLHLIFVDIIPYLYIESIYSIVWKCDLWNQSPIDGSLFFSRFPSHKLFSSE